MRQSGEGHGREDFDLPSEKMTIADEQDPEYTSSALAPSNSTI